MGGLGKLLDLMRYETEFGRGHEVSTAVASLFDDTRSPSQTEDVSNLHSKKDADT